MLSTAGVDCRVKGVQVDGRAVTVQVWDTAGQERFKTITRQYYRGAMGVMLVYDCGSLASFQHVLYWLQSIAQYAHSEVALLLVANKADMEDGRRQVSSSDGQQLAAQHSIAFIECSAKSSLNVDAAFLLLVRSVLQRLHLLLPAAASSSSSSAASAAAGGDGIGLVLGRAEDGVVNLAERRRSRQSRACSSCGHT